MEKYFFEISLFIVLVVFCFFYKKRRIKTLNTVNLALIKKTGEQEQNENQYVSKVKELEEEVIIQTKEAEHWRKEYGSVQ